MEDPLVFLNRYIPIYDKRVNSLTVKDESAKLQQFVVEFSSDVFKPDGVKYFIV